MEFFIKKNATLPILKLQVVKDGRSDYDNFMKTIELSAIFFSMVDVESGIPKISSRPAGFVEKEFIEPNAEPEYYIYYQFQNRDTNKVGRYEGQFMLRTDDGVLILPIREKLFINIQESFIADDLPYESCYTSEFPCCVNPPYITTTTTTPCPSCPTCPEPTPTPITTTTTTIEPITTTTTTIEPITTTTTTFPLSVILDVNINPGSIIIDYDLTSNQVYDEEISMSFTHILGVITGPPITIMTGVTIPVGETSGNTHIVLSDDFYNLSKEDAFGDVIINPSSTYWEIFENYPTPTPTVTPTNTATPTVTPTVTETPAQSLTPTPTVTETPSETPTPTVTETPTNTPTPTPTPQPIANITITASQVGNDVVFNAMGEFIFGPQYVPGLTSFSPGNFINGGSHQQILFQPSNYQMERYLITSSPGLPYWGSATFVADSTVANESYFGIDETYFYFDSQALSALIDTTMTFNNKTLSGMNLVSGTYYYTAVNNIIKLVIS